MASVTVCDKCGEDLGKDILYHRSISSGVCVNYFKYDLCPECYKFVAYELKKIMKEE